MLYAFGILIAIILALGGLSKCQHEEIVTLKADKKAAESLVEQAKTQGKADAIASQKDYDEALKTLVADRDKYRGRLRDPNPRACPAPTSTGVPADTSTGGELSDAAGAFLRSEADRADIAATYAAKCREYALKPTIRDQVNSLRSKP